MLYFLIGSALTLALIRLAWIDVARHRLPDAWTLPLIVAGLALALTPWGADPVSSLLGGAVGYGAFWAIGAFYFHRRGIDGLGLGDAKLFAAAGTWVGLAGLPYVLLIASVTGLGYAIALRKTDGTPLAFGPWLALGFWAVWMAQTTGWIGPIG